MSDPSGDDGLTGDERETLEWLRDNSDRLALIAETILEQEGSAPLPDDEQVDGHPSAEPTKRQGLPVGDAFVWIAYYGDQEDIEYASEEINATIEALRAKLDENEE